MLNNSSAAVVQYQMALYVYVSVYVHVYMVHHTHM